MVKLHPNGPLYVISSCSTWSFRLCNRLSLWRLVSWINHLPPACWSTFWKSNFKQQLGCRFDIMYNNSFCVFWHMQLYMSWYIKSFFGFTFLNILYFFKYSWANIFHRRSLYTFYWLMIGVFRCSDNALILMPLKLNGDNSALIKVMTYYYLNHWLGRETTVWAACISIFFCRDLCHHMATIFVMPQWVSIIVTILARRLNIKSNVCKNYCTRKIITLQ